MTTDATDEDVRVALYRGLASTGRCPDPADLAATTGVDDIAGALARLAGARHLSLDAGGDVVMAHPFTTRNLGFSVMGRSTL